MPGSQRLLVRRLPFFLLLAALADARAQGPAAPSFTTQSIFNAAGYSRGKIAPESWVTLYGSNLKVDNEATIVEGDYPASLGGTSVTVTDAAGVRHVGRLRYVAQRSLSFLAPGGMTLGSGTLTVSIGPGRSGSAPVEISGVNPGLFAANEDGQGAVLATFVRASKDGARAEGFTFISNAIAGTRSNFPIQFGPDGSEVYVSLWGTGFRGGAVTQVRIGDLAAPVLAAVAHSVFPGLDQAVVGPLPRALMNAGDVPVVLTSDGAASPPLTLGFLENPPPQSRIVYDLSAAIHGKQRLVIRRNTVRWVQGDIVPDPSEGSTMSMRIVTTVDGKKGVSASWQPRWSAQVPTTPGEESSIFHELWPPLPDRPVQVFLEMPLRLAGDKFVPVRGDIRIVQAPDASNDYTLVLDFDDTVEPGPGLLPVKIIIEPT